MTRFGWSALSLLVGLSIIYLLLANSEMRLAPAVGALLGAVLVALVFLAVWRKNNK